MTETDRERRQRIEREQERQRRDGGRSDERSPRSSEAQRAPAEVRPPTPREEAGESLQELEDPPQAEGEPRD